MKTECQSEKACTLEVVAWRGKTQRLRLCLADREMKTIAQTAENTTPHPLTPLSDYFDSFVGSECRQFGVAFGTGLFTACCITTIRVVAGRRSSAGDVQRLRE